MKANSNDCPQGTKAIHEKYLSNFKLMLMLLFFIVSFTQVANAQSCNGMTIKGSTSTSNKGEDKGSVSRTDEVISFTANLNRPNQAITWTIKQNKSAAFFTENRLTTIKKISVAGPNTVSVNVGPNHGDFTVKVTFDKADTPNTGSCSSSYSF